MHSRDTEVPNRSSSVGRAGQIEHDGERTREVQSKRDPLRSSPDWDPLRSLRSKTCKTGQRTAEDTTAASLKRAIGCHSAIRAVSESRRGRGYSVTAHNCHARPLRNPAASGRP